MRSDHPSLSSWSVAGVYLFGFLLFFWPLADLLTNTFPVRLGSLAWRYGFGGLLAAYLTTPILGLLLLMGAAYGLRHVRTLRLLSVFDILMALGILVVMVVFALDLLQVRAGRPPAARAAVLAGGIVAIAKHFSAALVLGLLGVGGWRTARKWSDGGRRRSETDTAARIVGKQKRSPGTPEDAR